MMTKIIQSCVLCCSVMASFSAFAAKEGELLIWINGDKGYNGLQKVGDRFAQETGIPVKVEYPDKLTDKFQKSAEQGNGPDIVIWAHDRFGDWAKSGLLVPVEPSQQTIEANSKISWDAVRYDGKYWGYPIAVEAIGLIYNKQLVETPPASFEDMFELDKQLSKKGKKAILWDYNNGYFTWPMLAANGGFVFETTEKGYNPAVTGVNNAGAVKGAAMLHRMIEAELMPVGASYNVMEAGFNQGNVAMMISGPWSWPNIRASKIDFGVAALPTVDGKPSVAFVGVTAAAINAYSPNKDLAIEFIEHHMLSIPGLKTINDDVSLGVVANLKLMEEFAKDPLIAATFENAKQGVPMPNIPEMSAFWAAIGPALSNITTGRQPVEDALNAAAARIVKDAQ